MPQTKSIVISTCPKLERDLGAPFEKIELHCFGTKIYLLILKAVRHRFNRTDYGIRANHIEHQ